MPDRPVTSEANGNTRGKWNDIKHLTSDRNFRNLWHNEGTQRRDPCQIDPFELLWLTNGLRLRHTLYYPTEIRIDMEKRGTKSALV